MPQQASRAEVEELVNFYKPLFGNNTTNLPYPAFPALSQIIGDLFFTLVRRNVLEATTNLYPDIPAWSYQASSYDNLETVGTFHGSDVYVTFYGKDDSLPTRSTRTFYNNFVYNLDPNDGDSEGPAWPLWSKNKQLMLFGASNNTLLEDGFSKNVSDWMSEHQASLKV